MFWLGNFCFLGRGCEPDPALARKWYKKAVRHGHYDAGIMLNKLENLQANKDKLHGKKPEERCQTADEIIDRLILTEGSYI